MAGQGGLEPPTNGFGDRRSTNWSYWPTLPLYVLCVSCKMDNTSLAQASLCSFSYPSCWYNSFFCTPNRQALPFHASVYSNISVITPAPTVLPPSLMAKRVSFSKATGAMSSTVSSTLSPGITISVPSGRWTVPVTSVVLM